MVPHSAPTCSTRSAGSLHEYEISDRSMVGESIVDRRMDSVADAAKRLRIRSESLGDRMDEDDDRRRSLDEDLPEAMLMEILSRLPDARDLVRCNFVSKTIQTAVSNVRSVRFLCRTKNVKRSGQLGVTVTPFKDTVTGTLAQLKVVEQLKLEIEDEIQANRYKDEEIESNSLWLSERSFVMKWVMPVCQTLQSLCVIDYGQQAIFHATPLLQILSANCKNLKTLELRNMYLDCKDCQVMPKVTALTLRCVKLKDKGLQDLNKCMPEIATLTLVTVVGLKEACLESSRLKVLCLGLASKSRLVRLKVPHLHKLQLKMACPDLLQVVAPSLTCLAVCMDRRDGANVEFKEVWKLNELLMGSSEFSTLRGLVTVNPSLGKVFLDVPCMQFDEHGVWKGVMMKQAPLSLPDMETMRDRCATLETLSIGPGLWHALEANHVKRKDGGPLPQWPALNRLILHLIVAETEISLGLLEMVVKAIPTLAILEVYIHADSPVDPSDFAARCQSSFVKLNFKWDKWKMGLRFDCFSF